MKIDMHILKQKDYRRSLIAYLYCSELDKFSNFSETGEEKTNKLILISWF